ncbi:MAG TPA: transaldolase family protein, partial [Pirellulaceae bacterium]|nr:transaldolase family protein [Pirellulaceae bacterium]
MVDSLKSLIASGTKLWLDSIDPDLVAENRARGATGATSNPIIISDLLKTGRFDKQLDIFRGQGLDDEAIAWAMTDQLVRQAQDVFHPVWQETQGNDGYVSFELDPLLEDLELGPPHDKRVARYVEQIHGDAAWNFRAEVFFWQSCCDGGRGRVFGDGYPCPDQATGWRGRCQKAAFGQPDRRPSRAAGDCRCAA